MFRGVKLAVMCKWRLLSLRKSGRMFVSRKGSNHHNPVFGNWVIKGNFFETMKKSLMPSSNLHI